MALLLLITMVGMLGFLILEDTDWLTALYHTICVLTTLGLPIEPERDVTKLFTIVLALSGIGLFFYSITVGAQFLTEGEYQRKVRRRKVTQAMKTLSEHFIICGYGRMGRLVASQLRERGLPFLVIELDEAKFHALEDEGILGLKGDASMEEVLDEAGIHRARALVTVTDTDAENILVTMTARQISPDLQIIARCALEENVNKLRRAGASRVITTYTTGAYQLTLAATKPNVIDWFELALGRSEHGFEIEEIEVDDESEVVGRTLRELALSTRFGVMIIGNKTATAAAMQFNPSAESQLAGGDLLICVGRAEGLQRLKRLLQPGAA